MPELDNETTFRGTVKKLLTTQYVIECVEVQAWYGVDARMPADLKPEGVELGDEILFGIKETKTGKPLVDWAEIYVEELPAVKRKASEAVEDSEEVYTGVVLKQSVKNPTMYFIDCAEVVNNCGYQAMMSEEDMPEDVDVGDTITFSLCESETGSPRAVQVQKVVVANKRARTAPAHHQAYVEGHKVGEVRYGSAEAAETAVLELHGSVLLGASIRVEVDKMSHDGTKIRIYGMPDGVGWQDVKDHFQQIDDVIFAKVFDDGPKGGFKGKGYKGGFKGGGGYSAGIGYCRFFNPADAEAALSFDGTEFEGRVISVEMDPNSTDWTKVRITGLPQGVAWQDIKDHFGQVGAVAHAGLGEDNGKGKGKGKGKYKW